MSRISGRYEDARSSRSQPAALVLYADGSGQLEYADARQRFVLAELSVSDRLADIPRRIRLPDGGVFVTEDNAAVDAVLSRLGADRGRGLAHRLESHYGWILILLIGALAVLWVLFAYAVPGAARHAAHALPPDMLDGLSRQTLELMDGHFLQPSRLEAQRQAEITAEFDGMRRFDGDYPFRLEFRRGGELIGANAFALPSGTLVLTDELVALAEHNEEILAILAHEMGHVVERHGLRQILQDSILALVLVLFTGDASSLAALVPVALLEMGYSRELERDADTYAVRVMDRAGIPRERFAGMLERLQQAHVPGKDKGGDAASADEWGYYLSTHPPTPERLGRIRGAKD